MSSSPLYLLNCSESYLSGSINGSQGNPSFKLQPNTTKYMTYPFFAKALWGPQQSSAGVLANGNTNIMYLTFSPDSTYTGGTQKVYFQLATPGYSGTGGPRPEDGRPLFVWIYQNFVLFSQEGKAQLQDLGTLPSAPGWRATPI